MQVVFCVSYGQQKGEKKSNRAGGVDDMVSCETLSRQLTVALLLYHDYQRVLQSRGQPPSNPLQRPPRPASALSSVLWDGVIMDPPRQDRTRQKETV